MNVNPGELNKRIEIFLKQEAEDQDGFGEPEEITVIQRWASFKRISGTEINRSNSDFSCIKARFLIRYTKTEIEKGMFIRYQNKEYEITYVNDYGDSHEYMEIWTELKEKTLG